MKRRIDRPNRLHRHQACRCEICESGRRGSSPIDVLRPRIVDSIAKYGAFVILVPGISYTVGLAERFQHSELVLLGASQSAGVVLNAFVKSISEGRRFESGEIVEGHLGNGYKAGLVEVPRERLRHLSMARAYYDTASPYYSMHPAALQVLWPDVDGALPMPFGGGCDSNMEEAQTWRAYEDTLD